MGTQTGLTELLDAVMFAAERHRNQRRKDADASPEGVFAVYRLQCGITAWASA